MKNAHSNKGIKKAYQLRFWLAINKKNGRAFNQCRAIALFVVHVLLLHIHIFNFDRIFQVSLVSAAAAVFVVFPFDFSYCFTPFLSRQCCVLYIFCVLSIFQLTLLFFLAHSLSFDGVDTFFLDSVRFVSMSIAINAIA